MNDLLRRSLAPLTDQAWSQIDETAARVLKTHLTARTFVDFHGPLGWDFASVNLGRLERTDLPAGQEGVACSVRVVLPLVEVRVPFTLSMVEVDHAARGCEDIELGPLEDAARKTALFEERAVYAGLSQGGIQGIAERASHEAVPLSQNTADFPKAVARGVQALTMGGAPAPYALVLGSDAWSALMHSGTGGYPPKRIIRDLLGGEILLSRAIQGGVLLSATEGNFQLTVGQDLAVGYAAHDRDEVELFLIESFTFRVLVPEAAIVLRPAG